MTRRRALAADLVSALYTDSPSRLEAVVRELRRMVDDGVATSPLTDRQLADRAWGDNVVWLAGEPPYPFCHLHMREACTKAGRCLREPVCND